MVCSVQLIRCVTAVLNTTHLPTSYQYCYLLLIPPVWQTGGRCYLADLLLLTHHLHQGCHTAVPHLHQGCLSYHTVFFCCKRVQNICEFQFLSVASDEDKIRCAIYFANWSNDQISHPVSQGRHGCPITGVSFRRDAALSESQKCSTGSDHFMKYR